MSILVESLKRLFTAGKVDADKLSSMVSKKTITASEYKYITGEKYTA